MKKTAGIILVVVMFVSSFFLVSCRGQSLTVDEAVDILSLLLPDARELTVAIYGEGLPYYHDYSEDELEEMFRRTGTLYIPVASNAAFTSRRAMEEAINATFSERMVRIFTADAFGHIGQIHPRYRENEQGWLMINLRRDIWPVMQEIHLDTLEVISTRRSVVTTYVYASRENGERIQIEIALVYENGRWVLNSLAY